MAGEEIKYTLLRVFGNEESEGGQIEELVGNTEEEDDLDDEEEEDDTEDENSDDIES